MAWRQASIVGVGATRQGKLPDETPLSLAAQAFRLALEDAGIAKREVDGLLTMPGTTSPEGPRTISMWGSSSASIRASPEV
jgi:3-oxoacyl-[acyl-carrier-protein] synthase III